VTATDATGRRLLVLGAGRHQVPLIRRAEERGVEVVVADYLPDSPGKRIATHSTMVDALDVDAVCDVASEFAVDGVVTSGTDQAVVTMAAVADRFGLPQIVSPHTARLATDKRCMKEALQAAGVAMSRYVGLRRDGPTEAVDALRVPVVVKPTDSQGQRGTRRVDDRRELGDAIDAAFAAGRSDEIVVEEFVEGMEVTASAWVDDGEVHVLMVTDRVTYNPPPAIGIAVQHVYPSLYAAPVLDIVRENLERIRAAYALEHGPMYVQMIVTPDDDVQLVEAACRVGGGHEIALVPLVTGCDLRDRLIDLALTGACEPVVIDDARASSAHALVNFLVAQPGTFAEQTGIDDLVRDGTLVEGGFYHPIGYEQQPVRDGQGRVGYFIAQASSRDALLQKARDAFAHVSVRGTDGEELAYWPEPQWVRGWSTAATG
jgi:biotin carboxylase